MEEELNIKMLGGDVLVSANSTTALEDSNLMMTETADMSEDLDVFQRVLKTGPRVIDVKEGDTICINMMSLNVPIPKWMKKTDHPDDDVQDGYNMIIDPSKIIEIGDKTYLKLRESDIAYIVG